IAASMTSLLTCGPGRQPGLRSSWVGSTRPSPHSPGALFAGVTGKERVALGGREVAAAGPAGGEWQAMEATASPAQLAEGPGGGTRGKTVQGRPAGKETPQCQIGTRKRGYQMTLELAFAPVAHQLQQRDLHGTDALALAAKGGGIGQMARLLNADQRWG